MNRISIVILVVAVLLLTAAGPPAGAAEGVLAPPTYYYQSLYEYDPSGRVGRAFLRTPEGTAYEIRYTYTPTLAEARIIHDGQVLRRYLYTRDPNGRLLEKTIVSQAGWTLGTVRLSYDTTGRILRVQVNAPCDLPPWDPLVDR